MFNRILVYAATAILVSLCSKGGLAPDGSDDTPKAEVTLLSSSSVTIPSAGGEATIEFEASDSWAVSATIPGSDNGKDWLIIKGTNGDKGKGKTVVELKPNETDADRNFTINIYAGLLQTQTVEHVSVKQPCKANDNPGEAPGEGPGENPGEDPGSSENADFLARVDDTQYSGGSDYLYVTVEVANKTSASANVEYGLEFSSSSSLSNPRIIKAKETTLAAGATESAECFIDGLAQQTSYYFRPYAKVGDKKYLGEIRDRSTDKNPYLYLNSENAKEYSFGEQGGTFNLGVYSNLRDFQVNISADWVKVVEEERLYHNSINTYKMGVDANTTESDRSAKIVFSNEQYGLSIEVSVIQSRKVAATGVTDGHEWVNLALPSGTLWASMNVGASKPEEYGRYVAWGESVIIGEEDLENAYNFKNYNTYVKDNYSSDSYKFFHDEGYQDGDNIWHVGKTHVLHKYCKDDKLETLEPKDDAATVKWGEKWTMPTADQLSELISNTHKVWTDNYKGSGIKGGIFYRKKADGDTYNPDTDVHIFFPASGYGNYKKYDNQGVSCNIWSKTMRNPKYASNPYYDVETMSFAESIDRCSIGTSGRDYGRCVRAVVK